MNIKKRIDALIGNAPIDPQLQGQYLDDAVRQLIAELPEEVLLPMATEITDPDGTAGISIEEHRILRAHKEGYAAKRIDLMKDERIIDETDGGGFYPVYYVIGTMAYVRPDGGNLLTVQKPTITLTDVAATFLTNDVPSLFIDLVILRTALLCIDHVMARQHQNLDLTITVPALSAVPGAPVITYEDASAVAPSAVSVGTLPTVPSFMVPVFGGDLTIPSLPTLDLTLDVEGNALTIPTVPTAPSISAALVTAAGVSATTISALPTAPVYSLVVPTLNFGDWTVSEGEEDTEMMARRLDKLQADLATFNARISDANNQLSEDNLEYQAEVGKRLEQARLDQQRILQVAQNDNEVSLRHEAERVGTELREYEFKLAQFAQDRESYINQSRLVTEAYDKAFDKALRPWAQKNEISLAVYGTDIQAQKTVLDAQMADFNADVQAAMENARIGRSEAEQTASQSTEVAVRNKAENMRAQIASFEASLTQFQADIGRSAATVENKIKATMAEAEVMGNKLRMLNFDRNRVVSQYNQAKSNYMRFYWPHRSYTVRYPSI